MADRQKNQVGGKRRTSILKATSTINNGGDDDMTMANELNQPTRRVSFNHIPKVKEFDEMSSKYSEKENPPGKSTPFRDAECETPSKSPLQSGFVNDTRALFDAFKPQLGGTSTLPSGFGNDTRSIFDLFKSQPAAGGTSTPAPSPTLTGFMDNTQAVFNACLQTDKLRLTSTPALTSMPSAFMDTTKQLFGRLNKFPAVERSEHDESTSSSSFELSASPVCPAFGSPTFKEEEMSNNTTPRRIEFQDEDMEEEEVADAGQADEQPTVQEIEQNADPTRIVEHSLFEDHCPPGNSMNPRNNKVQQIMEEGLAQHQRAESPALHLDLSGTPSSRHSEEEHQQQKQPEQQSNATPEDLQNEEEMLDAVAKYGTIGGADKNRTRAESPALHMDLSDRSSSRHSAEKHQQKHRQNMINTPEELQDEEEMLDAVAKYGTIGGADRTHVIQHTPYLSRILGNNTMITGGSGSKVQLLDDLTHHQHGGGSLLFGSQDNSDLFGGDFSSGKSPAIALNFDTPSRPQHTLSQPADLLEEDDSHTAGMGEESHNDESENNDSDDMETAQLPAAKQLAPVLTARLLATTTENVGTPCRFNDVTAAIAASAHELSLEELASPPHKLRRPSHVASSSTLSQPPPPPSPQLLPMAHLDDAQFEQWHDAELEQAERAYFAEMERRHEVYKVYYDAEMRKLDVVQNTLERISKFRKEIRDAEKRDKGALRALLPLSS